MADALVAAGIEGILNFAPVTLSLPETVEIIGVDLAIELEQLSFAVVRRRAKPVNQRQATMPPGKSHSLRDLRRRCRRPNFRTMR